MHEHWRERRFRDDVLMDPMNDCRRLLLLLIRNIIHPTVVRFCVDCIEEIDLHILEITINRLMIIEQRIDSLPQQHSLLHDVKLQKYIFVLDHLYSFVNREAVQQLKQFQLKTMKIDLSIDLLRASNARNFDRSNNNFV